jgi:zinc and cadmium transporter
MINIWLYTFGSVLIVSLLALFGIFFLVLKEKVLKKILLLLVSFSAGALFGGVFFHLLPEIVKEKGFTPLMSIYILTGIVFSFFIEKIVHWRHCHLPVNKNHIHPASIMSLTGDAVHNFIDGIVIAGAYLISIPLGITTTLAVILHEIPQEIGDFGVLLYGGFSKKKALLLNFLTALTAFLGAFIALLLSRYIGDISNFIVPFAVGNFIYIAGSDLIPELHKECKVSKSILELFIFILGIGVMMLMLLFE